MNEIASDYLIKIFNQFNQKSINYIVLRNYEKLPFDNTSKDVDILIKPDDIDKSYGLVLNTAKELGYKCIWINKLDYLIGLVLAKVENGIIYSVKIDLFIGLKWRGIDYIDSELVLSKSIPYKEFFIPSKECESFIMIMYYTLYAKKIRDKYTDHICSYAKYDIKKFSNILNVSLNYNLEQTITQMIEQNNIKEVIIHRKKIINNLLKKNIKLSSIYSFYRHIRTEYFDRRNFGTIVIAENLDSSEFKLLNDCFISLGIADLKQKNIKVLLRNNNILLTDKNIKNFDSKAIKMFSKDSFENKINKLFDELEKRYLK